LVDLLDAPLGHAYPDDVDVHTRWIATLADAPLFGAARRWREEQKPKCGSGPTSDPSTRARVSA
jgi:hypothetical protein